MSHMCSTEPVMPISCSKGKRGAQPYTKRKASGSLPQKFPSVLRFCDCSECSEHPGVNPVTGLPTDGRYLPPAEFKAHGAREHQRGVVTARLHDLTPPAIPLPSPPPTIAGLSSLPSLSMPRAEIPVHNVSILPRPIPIERPGSTPNSLLYQLQVLLDAIKPAEIVAGSESLVFRMPPTLYSLPLVQSATDDEIDAVCELDPVVRSNSLTIGYQQLLSRLETFVHLHLKSPDVALRLRCEIVVYIESSLLFDNSS
jgi:hypothetical protein